jgi:hypothetical protein
LTGRWRWHPSISSICWREHLLDPVGHPETGEAYSRALAQPHPNPLPPMLMQTIPRAEALWVEHRHTLQQRLGAAVEASGADLTPAERRRAARFASNIAGTSRTFHSEPAHLA